MSFIGFGLCNLFVPGEPETFSLSTPAGTWEFKRLPQYEDWKEDILHRGQCGTTYEAVKNVDTAGSRTVALEEGFDELLPICLGASYLTAMTVSPDSGIAGSKVSFIRVGDHFPRPRGMGPGHPAVDNVPEFKANLEAFVPAYMRVEKVEKARLLIHHWLDALAFWSLEHLVLSTTTLLEVIAATAEDLSQTPLKSFAGRVAYAANRFGLPSLNPGFRAMRNDLVHEGTLSGSDMPNATVEACATFTADALNWIDLYLHAIFDLGNLRAARFDRRTFQSVNAFSLE